MKKPKQYVIGVLVENDHTGFEITILETRYVKAGSVYVYRPRRKHLRVKSGKTMERYLELFKTGEPIPERKTPGKNTRRLLKADASTRKNSRKKHLP